MLIKTADLPPSEGYPIVLTTMKSGAMDKWLLAPGAAHD
jgi:hypothetical protein